MNRSVARALVAGPLAFITAFLAMAATPLWASSSNGIDHIVLPIVLFPAYWAATCIYAVIDERILRAAIALLGLSGISALLIFRVMAG